MAASSSDIEQQSVQEAFYNQSARAQIKASCADPCVLDYIEALEAVAQAARVLYLPLLPGDRAVYTLYDTLARVDWMNE